MTAHDKLRAGLLTTAANAPHTDLLREWDALTAEVERLRLDNAETWALVLNHEGAIDRLMKERDAEKAKKENAVYAAEKLRQDRNSERHWKAVAVGEYKEACKREAAEKARADDLDEKLYEAGKCGSDGWGPCENQPVWCDEHQPERALREKAEAALAKLQADYDKLYQDARVLSLPDQNDTDDGETNA